MPVKCFYFGVADSRSGHSLWYAQRPGFHPFFVPRKERERLPWRVAELDGGLLPKSKRQPEGRCVLRHQGGWTAMAFWDRSGDKRYNSNSVVLAEGEHDFEGLLDLFRREFPAIYERVMARFSLIAEST